MQIIHKLNDFFFILFPEIGGGSNELIVSKLTDFYKYGPFKPKVTVKDDLVIIDIDVPSIISQEADYKKTVALCERGKYAEAKPILKNLLEKNPTNSEYHRIMGQILSDEGQQDEAIDFLIDALRWDSKNNWALLMLGNIFARFKNDIDTALKYYEQALKVNPDDFISLTNTGYLLLQSNRNVEAIRFLEAAVKAGPAYPNAHLSLSLALQNENKLPQAFEAAVTAMKLAAKNVQVKQQAEKQAFSLARQITRSNTGKQVVESFRTELENEAGTAIDLIEDSGITTLAKMELAENYNRPNHAVRIKPGVPAGEHLVMHELFHLKLIIDARKAEVNQLFTSNQALKKKFTADYSKHTEKLISKNIPAEKASDYMLMLVDGINLQAFNTPIDLFIEQLIYDRFPELRPWQMVSLRNLIETGIQAVTEKKVLEYTPTALVSKTRIYNLVNAMQYRDLYGADLVMLHKPTAAELKQAEAFYAEYLEYRNDRQPAEEYELVQHWAEDLKLDGYFELVGEKQYRRRANPQEMMEALEADPLGMEDHDPAKEREQRKFDKWQQSGDVNMAVVFYMVAALQYLEKLPPEKVQRIAWDIAMQGTQGFSPDKEDYTVPSIPGKTFTGTQILAWFYASWALAKPSEVDQLGLNFSKEWEMAKGMNKTK